MVMVTMRGDQFFSQVAIRPPFTKLHPRVGEFLKNYFAKEKVISFGDRMVVNTNFPPYPSAAFDHLAQQFAELGDASTRSLYSVTLAVTNQCPFNCWHCYNAGRSQADIPLPHLKSLAAELQNLGAVMVTLTGGEPLLRPDLEDIAGSFDARSCLVLGTTGAGLTPERARSLRGSGFFAIGLSLDSDQEAEHDRLRGKTGAFRAALRGLEIARANGLFPYVVAVATREFLQRDRFLRFLRFAAAAGALEVHLLEPSATGRLAGQMDVLLSAAERRQLFDYQGEVAQDPALPILSAFSYLESPEAFGCGAGLTHLYIDGSGEVCPCNLVPLSFGNLTKQPIRQILDRMGRHFCRPRTGCVGRQLVKHFPSVNLPASPEQSEAICECHLPQAHALPAFFRLRDEVRGQEVGAVELQAAYNRVHGDYDAFWLAAAAKPVDDLVQQMDWRGTETVFEAGCGTGYATALLARRSAQVLAVDLSEAMLSEAQVRIHSQGINNVRFVAGDAVANLEAAGRFERIFSSWVLGYIPLATFFTAASQALTSGGQLAFIVHKENSPREPLEIFAELVAEEPAALQKRVAFDFPRDLASVRALLMAAGLEIDRLWEDSIVFRYDSAELVLEHLLKSGAGTAFYDAIDPARRDSLTARFLERITQRQGPDFLVRHEYIACLAQKS
jgi:MoaA/NifB/PqqE/SkfB family radical SAM enzyme/protein-L-isoaspartate O-methyltransferase